MPVSQRNAAHFRRFQQALRAAGCRKSDRVGLAVSGGGDSIAMMHMAARIIDPANLYVLTVDHGLRPEAADEIALVADQAKALGLSHDVARWSWDMKGNLQAAARAGRWDAILDWAAPRELNMIFMGHTEDDQIETVLLRLARGSGIDGLAAMARADYRDGLRVVRPLLDVPRAGLRDWLRGERISWCDDPSNDDPRFDRVRARQMYSQLEKLGLTRKRLLQTVEHVQAAHRSLQRAALDFARIHVRQDSGDLVFAPVALKLDKEDAPRRVMAAAFGWVSGNMYRPRFDRMLDVVAQAAKGHTVTLGGCVLLPHRGAVRLTRETSATTPLFRDASAVRDVNGIMWDRRWYLAGPLTPGLEVRALADAIRHCPDWRESGLPRKSLLASPSVWNGETLLAAPLAGLRNGWTAQIVADFHSTAFAH
ncbi:tRNA lysidine(34) synthetase TilS [Loktanella agnita]|uniref:tRNA lysidine(34) synthetase TilS n=1 Tax=Loktanella agnita TaxID=287097 RepID=UPI0039864040